MTTFTGPLIVASGSNQGDGSYVAKVSVNGKVESDADASFSGQLVGGGHTLAASAVTLNVPTTVATSTIAGSSLLSAAAWPQFTINGTTYFIPAFTSA